MWPEHFKGLRDPVVPVLKAIYGHPESRGAGKSTAKLLSTEPDVNTYPTGRPCTGTPKLNPLLMVYVDDFKMAGPAGNLEAGWKTITGGDQACGDRPCV